MARFKRGELKSGKSGKPVTDKKQAMAIALSACGESKYSENLQSMGYSADVADAVSHMFAEIDWEKNFRTGKTPDVTQTTKVKAAKSLADGISGKRKETAEMISGPALPKGPGNPQGGSSRDVTGLRMFQEGECPGKRKKPDATRTTEEKKADQQRRAASTGKNNVSTSVRSEAAKKAAETRARCKSLR